MKNRIKLSFSQLQAEMSHEKQLIVDDKELAQLSGGLTIDEFVSMMQGWGFDFRNDASGNYYYESLPDVVVTSSYEQVYGMSWDEWNNKYGYLTNPNDFYQGTDPSWQGYPNSYPGTGGSGGGITGTGTNNNTNLDAQLSTIANSSLSPQEKMNAINEMLKNNGTLTDAQIEFIDKYKAELINTLQSTILQLPGQATLLSLVQTLYDVHSGTQTGQALSIPMPTFGLTLAWDALGMVAENQYAEDTRIIFERALDNGYDAVSSFLQSTMGKNSGIDGVYITQQQLDNIINEGSFNFVSNPPLYDPSYPASPTDNSGVKMDYFVIFNKNDVGVNTVENILIIKIP